MVDNIKTKKVLIDHIEGIEINQNDPPLSNIQCLMVMEMGIAFLANTVRDEEIRYSETGLSLFIGSSINPIIKSCFDWFVISTTNFVRIVGLLDLMSNNKWTSKDLTINANRPIIKRHCDNYTNKIIPEINKWRNKVSAHPAATSPRSEDNVATIEQSLMSLINYHKPYFRIGNTVWHSGGKRADLPDWALSEVYESKLIPRYWPNKHLKKI